MKLTAQSLSQLAVQSVTDPRGAARALMGAGVPDAAIWPGLIVVVLLSTLVSGGLNLLSPAVGPLADLMARPFISALVTFSTLVLTIFGLHWAGRMFGGQGRLLDMALTMTWLQVVLFVGQLALLVVTLAVPPLGSFLFLGFFGLSLWMALSFVDAVHGFGSLLKSFGVIAFALLAIGFGLSILLSLIGVGAEGVVNNV